MSVEKESIIATLRSMMSLVAGYVVMHICAAGQCRYESRLRLNAEARDEGGFELSDMLS
jgi:hypothetical protein